MNIRPAIPTDKEEWLRMRLALWPDTDLEDELQEVTHFLDGNDPPLPTLLAAFVCVRPEGGLCGLVELSIHTSAPGCHTDRIGYLEAWFVDEDYRGKGVGRALIATAEGWAKKLGCTEMASDTTPDYPISPEAHAALGFDEVERYFRKEI